MYNDTNVNTIVIGAGISGLAAAKILSKEKLSCFVLEARNRHGGRINTIDWTHDGKKLHADLGANYLHGCTPYQEVQPLFSLASKIDVKTSVAPGDVLGPLRGWECLETAIWRRSDSGKEISLEEVSEIGYLMDRCLIRILSNQTERNKNIPLSVSFPKALKANLSVLSKAKKFPKVLETFQHNILMSFCNRYLAYVNPLERISSYLNLGPHFKQSAKSKFADDAKRPTQEEKNMHLDWLIEKRSHILKKGPQSSVAKKVTHSWEDRLVLSGFSKFTDFLSKDVPILYEKIVKIIDWSDPDQIKITALDPEGKEFSYFCKHCIISLPVGVLKGLDDRSRVQFIPELPKAKRKAIDKLGIPHIGAKTHDKIVMAFSKDDVFWDVDYPNIESDDPRLHILNLHYYGQTGVLLFHIWAGSNVEIHGKSDEEIFEKFLELLGNIYPDKKPLPRPYKYFITRWSEDPFTLGSYTEGEIGSGDKDRNTYAASLPSKDNSRLLFCGEATLDSKGSQQCTHGAFLTGVNKAIEVLTQERQQEINLSLSRIIDYLTNPSIDSLFSTHSMVSRRRSSVNKNVDMVELPLKQSRPRRKSSTCNSNESISSVNSNLQNLDSDDSQYSDPIPDSMTKFEQSSQPINCNGENSSVEMNANSQLVICTDNNNAFSHDSDDLDTDPCINEEYIASSKSEEKPQLTDHDETENSPLHELDLNKSADGHDSNDTAPIIISPEGDRSSIKLAATSQQNLNEAVSQENSNSKDDPLLEENPELETPNETNPIFALHNKPQTERIEANMKRFINKTSHGGLESLHSASCPSLPVDVSLEICISQSSDSTRDSSSLMSWPMVKEIESKIIKNNKNGVVDC